MCHHHPHRESVSPIVGANAVFDRTAERLADVPDPQPTYVTAERLTTRDESSATLTWKRGERDVLAVRTEQPTVVTAIHVRPGDQLRDGDPILDLNGETILASTAGPFYRDLVRRDEGSDVVELQRFLTRQGLLETPLEEGVLGTRTRDAIKEYNGKWIGRFAQGGTCGAAL